MRKDIFGPETNPMPGRKPQGNPEHSYPLYTLLWDSYGCGIHRQMLVKRAIHLSATSL